MKLVFVAFCILSLVHHEQCSLVATANIHIDSSAIGVGTLLFHQRDEQSPVRIVGIIDGLKSNTVHGFHVHRDPLMNGELSCNASGPHLNPYGNSEAALARFHFLHIEKLHGPREADLQHRHVGDLGNVTANENGIIIVEITDSVIDLYNATRSIANRTIVLHAMRDDGGSGGFPDSNTTGNAGPRIACGVISLTMEESNKGLHTSRISTMVSDFLEKVFP